MSFDEVTLPLKIEYGAMGGPCFFTELVTVSNGYESRNQNWSQARRKYDARTGVRTSEDAAILLAFFHARSGRARGFRLRDWSDYSSAVDGFSEPKYDDQLIAVGDGNNTLFQLIKNYGSKNIIHKRLIKKPVIENVLLGVDGVIISSGYSVNVTNGIVTFSTPPDIGKQITAGYYFDVPVRFDSDQMNISLENGFQTKAEIPLIEIRV